MILMIDNYDSFTYNIVQELGMLGADVKVVKNDAATVDELEAMQPAAVVFGPGPGNPDSAGVTLAAIKRFAGKVPILGVCLGHQSIAQAFGGKIIGAKCLMHERATHPDCFEITAETDDGEIMGLRHKTLPIESLQYHPESIGTPDGIRQLQNFLDLVKEFHA